MARSISRKSFLQLGTGLAGSLVLGPFRNDFNTSAMDNISKIVRGDLILKGIPSSGEKLPAIGMGTWLTFDAGNSEIRRKDLTEVLRIFNKNGGKLIDSSPMYGSSERVAGDLMTDLKIRKDTFIATKVWTTGEADGITQMQQSIQKMQAGIMDLMQVHNLVDAHVHLPTLRKWKAEGKVRYIGITHYQVSAYPELMELIKKEKLDFVQFNYNIRVREAEKKLLPFCKDNGVAVINNRPLDGGDLFGRTAGKPVPAWARDYDIQNWAQYFLKYIISHPAVTCAIPATSKPAHMEENIGAAYGRLPDEVTRRKMVDFFEKL
jgi:diketogulonate reductase-like aldo/keto reductase